MNNENNTLEMSKIYEISEKYNISKIDNSWNCEQHENKLSLLIKMVNDKDKGYNIRINPDLPCIVYGDVDHLKNEGDFEKVLNILSNIYDIETDLISYTKSFKDDVNEYSYHFSIPSIETSVHNLKKTFSSENKRNNYFDLSIYSDKFFRLPNQTNKQKPYAHKIINGTMEDFFIHNISNVKEKVVDDEEDDDEDDETEVEETNDKNKLKFIEGKTKEDFIKELLNIVSNMSENFEEWRNIGFILYHELKENGFKIFDDFSRLSNKYNKKNVKTFWNSISTSQRPLTLGSLRKYASDENPTEYKRIIDEYFIKKSIVDFKTLWSTGYIADLFKICYNDKFIFSNGKLYHFNNTYWEIDDKNKSILNNFVDTTFHNFLLEELHYFDINAPVKDTKHVEIIVQKRSEINREIRDIKGRTNVIKDIINKLTDNKIIFDENPYLFAFENKIYDLKQSKFIEPKAEQYISITTGYKFSDENQDAKKVELENLLKTIFPDPDILNLYLTILSTGLDGIPLEKFVLANGEGGNGKGLLNDLVLCTLGNYGYVMPVNVLLEKIKTGCNPEVANLNKKRFVISREPDKNSVFNNGTIKDLTGGDEIAARTLYSENTVVRLCLTLLLECNNKPKLSEILRAEIRRILDMPFKNKFVDKQTYKNLDEEEKKTTFLINTTYKTNDFKKDYRQAFFLILIDYHKEFLKNNRELNVPDEIIQRNNDYFKKSDDLFNWLDNTYTKTNDVKDIIKLKDVYKLFTTSEYYNNLTKAQKRENNYKTFVENLEKNIFLKKYVRQNKDKVYVLTNYKESEDDEDDEDNKKFFLDI